MFTFESFRSARLRRRPSSPCRPPRFGESPAFYDLWFIYGLLVYTWLKYGEYMDNLWIIYG